MSGHQYRSVRAADSWDVDPILSPAEQYRERGVIPLRKVLRPTILQRLVEAVVQSLWLDYRTASVRIHTLPVQDATPLAISVDTDRLWRTDDLLWEYGFARAEPYEPVLVRKSSTTPWRLLLPPIIEAHDEVRGVPRDMYVVDGMHRLCSLRQHRKSKAVALMISTPHLPPPAAHPHDSWQDVWHAEANKVRGEARFCGLNMALLRPVSETVDRDEWLLPTLRGEQVFPTKFPTVDDCRRRATELFWVASRHDMRRNGASSRQR
jgi:hypothetical protein